MKYINLKTGVKILISFAILLFSCNNSFAEYHSLECSDYYSGYCSETDECFSQFGDYGIDTMDYCFQVSYQYPRGYTYEIDALNDIGDQIDMIKSPLVFMAHLLGYWLPFGVIANFSMWIIFILLFKFKYFK